MKKFTVKRIATLGLLTALALISFLIENLFPPLFLPGTKLGVSNIFTLLCICLLSPLDGIILLLCRTILASFFVGSTSSLLYSLSAGLLSTAVAAFLLRFAFPKISVLSVSVLSAVVHNIVQNLVFFLTTGSSAAFMYMPYLIAIGAFSGGAVGAVVTLIMRYRSDAT